MMLEVGSKDSYDSTEEYLFALWLQSASEFVFDAKYHPSPFVLFEARDGLRDHVYTADWMVFWRQNAKGVYFIDEGEKVPKTRSGEPVVPFVGNPSYIDVKGGFLGKNNSSGITFPINQKWVLDKYGIFINKTVITYEKKGLFFKTYVPDSVLDVSNYVRTGLTKFKFQPRTFDEFTKGRVIL
jgi:hypothetical protein